MAKTKKAPKAVKPPSCTFEQVEQAGLIPIYAEIGGNKLPLGVMQPKKFSTGSYGFNLNGKASLTVPGGIAACQMSLNCTVINSGKAKAEKTEETPEVSVPVMNVESVDADVVEDTLVEE